MFDPEKETFTEMAATLSSPVRGTLAVQVGHLEGQEFEQFIKKLVHRLIPPSGCKRQWPERNTETCRIYIRSRDWQYPNLSNYHAYGTTYILHFMRKKTIEIFTAKMRMPRPLRNYEMFSCSWLIPCILSNHFTCAVLIIFLVFLSMLVVVWFAFRFPVRRSRWTHHRWTT